MVKSPHPTTHDEDLRFSLEAGLEACYSHADGRAPVVLEPACGPSQLFLWNNSASWRPAIHLTAPTWKKTHKTWFSMDRILAYYYYSWPRSAKGRRLRAPALCLVLSRQPPCGASALPCLLSKCRQRWPVVFVPRRRLWRHPGSHPRWARCQIYYGEHGLVRLPPDYGHADVLSSLVNKAAR